MSKTAYCTISFLHILTCDVRTDLDLFILSCIFELDMVNTYDTLLASRDGKFFF